MENQKKNFFADWLWAMIDFSFALTMLLRTLRIRRQKES